MFDILKANFDAAYNGNRAPLPIFIHSPWLRQGSNLEDLQRFAGGASGRSGCAAGASSKLAC